MTERKIFTKDELETLGKLTVDLIEASIDAKEGETAKKLSRRMYREFLSLHDLYRDWITALLSFIGRRYGGNALYEALKETCTPWMLPLCDRYAGKDIRQKVEMLAAGLRAHLQPVQIEEDEEKFTFTMHPCGSGGRLVLEGAYDQPRNFLKVEKAQPMTFNQPNFPVYCAHCFFQNSLPTELHKMAPFITEPPQKIGEEPCRAYVYK